MGSDPGGAWGSDPRGVAQTLDPGLAVGSVEARCGRGADHRSRMVSNCAITGTGPTKSRTSVRKSMILDLAPQES